MIINLNGRIVPESEARLPVLDHGFLCGYSVYETLRTYGGKPFLLDLHLARLQDSAHGVHLELPVSLEQLKQELLRTLEITKFPESTIRIIVSRGQGDLSYDPELCGTPNFIILVKLLKPEPNEIYEQGVIISLVSVRRNLASALNPAVKSGNLLNQSLAWIEGKRKGAYEALMLNYKGELAECAMSNIFLVKDQRLRTPALDCGILPGLTRSLILEIATKADMEVQEASLFPEDFYQAEEAFLSMTSREIIPVVRCDDCKIGEGIPGPITKLLHTKYRHKIRELMESE